MKVRVLLSILAGVAISVAAPEVRQQIEAVTKRREEAYNKHDAAAWAAFYTQDAIDVWTWLSEGGAAVGLPAIEKRYTAEFASAPAKQSIKVVQVYAIGNQICVVTEFPNFYHGKRHAVVIYVHDADDWKVRLSYMN